MDIKLQNINKDGNPIEWMGYTYVSKYNSIGYGGVYKDVINPVYIILQEIDSLKNEIAELKKEINNLKNCK